MKQIILACSFGLTLAAPAAAETKDERVARCEKQGEIIGKAAEARLARTREAKANTEILETTDAAYHPSVPILVGHIYTLSRGDLKDVDVKAAFVEQCSGFDPNQ